MANSNLKIKKSRNKVRGKLNRWKLALRVFGLIMLLLVITSAGVFGYFYTHSKVMREFLGKYGGQMAMDTLEHGNPLASFVPAKQFPGQSSINVLIMGVDRDYNHRDQVLNTPGRSDSILLARVDFTHDTVAVLSIPRDAAVRIPGYHGIYKINAAHEFGGNQLAMQTVQSVFGVTPNYALAINFHGFQELVNAIGGIDLYVPKDLNYDDNWANLHIHLKKGLQHLNGYQAMGFVRMRHTDSDYMRMQRQHEFLEALRTKIQQPSIFLKLPTALDEFAYSLQTSMSQGQMLALLNFVRDLPQQNIVVQTTPSNEGPSFVSLDLNRDAQVIQQLFYPGQQVPIQINAPSPQEVALLNAPYEPAGYHPVVNQSSPPVVQKSNTSAQPTSALQQPARPNSGSVNPSSGPASPGTTGTPSGTGGGLQSPASPSSTSGSNQSSNTTKSNPPSIGPESNNAVPPTRGDSG